MWPLVGCAMLKVVADSWMKRHVLTNLALMRLCDSELSDVYADAMPSEEADIDVIVFLTVLDVDTAQKVRAMLQEARVEVRQGGRPRLM
jgi:hypothetical protein